MRAIWVWAIAHRPSSFYSLLTHDTLTHLNPRLFYNTFELDSVEFDCDHLYQFTYKNRFGRITNVNHPALNEPPFVEQVRVGDLPLEPGANMTYVFDFGDWWEFNVQLEEIKPLDGKIEQPKVLKKSGKSPQQYPDWDEWEEEDDE